MLAPLILFRFGHIWLLAWGTCVGSWGGVFVFFICYSFRGLDELGYGGVGRGESSYLYVLLCCSIVSEASVIVWFE